jgi:hypothetical protein
MAGTTERQAPDAKHYVEYEEYVDFQLEKTRSSIKRTDILTTLTTLAVVLVAYLLTFVVFDQWVFEGGFGYTARVVLLCVLAIVVLGTLTWRVLWPLLRHVHPLYAARVIEKSDPNLKSNLVNFVDVRQSNAQSAPIVMKAMQKRAAVELSHIDVDEAVDHRPLLRIAYALLAVVIISALYIIFSPKDPFASVRRALLPTAAIEVATETTISDVDPGDRDVPARTILKIEADVRGKEADRVQILYSTADLKYVDQPVEMRRIEENSPRFRGVLNGENGRGLMQSLTYRLVAGDARTKDYTIRVIQPPSARVDDVHYVFPPYMQFEEKTTAGGHIDGWEGATVTVRATTNMPVKRATIVLTDAEDSTSTGKEEVTMMVTEGTKLSATWPLEIRPDGTSPRYYHIQVKTENGETDPDPTQYPLRIRPDQRPEVVLLAPTGDLDAPANGIIPLIIQAVDPDFLLRSITLKAENRGESLRDQKLFVDQLDVQSFRGKHDFALEPLSLKAGDTLYFWIEAKDNKAPTANRGTTPRVEVRIGKPASAQEVQNQLARDKEKQQEQISRADDTKKAGERPSPQAGNEDETDKADRRPEPPAPGEERPKNEKRERDNDAANPPRNEEKEGQKHERPDRDDFQQQLQKLMQKEQEQKAGEKDDNRQDENKEKQERDQQQQAQDQGDRGKEGNQKSADGSKGKSQKNGSADQKSKGSDNNQSQNGQDGQQEKSGGEGKSTDKKDQSSRSQDQRTGDQNQKKSGSPGSKPNEDQKNPGEEHSDNKNGGSQSGKDKPSKEGGPSGDEKTNDAKNSTGKNNTGKQDDGKNDTEKNDTQKNEGSKANDRSEGSDKNTEKSSSDSSSKPDKPGANPDKPGADEQSATEQQNQKQGGSGKDQADQSDPASNSKESSKGKGSPSKSDKPEGDEQEGDGQGQKSKKTGDSAKKPGKDTGESGEEKPADESPDAVKKKATGNETGDATGDQQGDPQAPKAKNDLNKKPDSKPSAKNPTGDSDPDAKKSAQQRKSEDGTKSSNDDAERAQRAPDGKKDTEQPPGQIDDPSSEKRPDLKKDGTGEKRPGTPPEGGNQQQKGQGRKEGQKADNADTGEEGSSTATDQGKEGANKKGAGTKSDEPGDSDPSSKKTGQPGKKKGEGSTTQPADKQGTKEKGPGEESGKQPSSNGDKGKPGEKSGQSPEGQSPDSKSSDGKSDSDGSGKKEGNKPGDNKGQSGEGKTGDKPGDQQGKGNSGKSDSQAGSNKNSGQSTQPGKPGNQGSQRSGGGVNQPPGNDKEPTDAGAGPSDAEGAKPRENGDDDEPPPPQDEEARLDYARKASNLVLNRLKGQLERGEVDQELLDELGWKNKADVERFVKMLEEGLKDQRDDNSPEAIARRLQFEEMLKSMKLGNETTSRKGGAAGSRTIQQIGGKNAPVPPEYQKLVESYTRSLSKQADKSGDKAGDKTKKKSEGK